MREPESGFDWAVLGAVLVVIWIVFIITTVIGVLLWGFVQLFS